MMTKRQARYMDAIKRAEGVAYTLPEDGLAGPGMSNPELLSIARPVTVDAEGFWRAVMDTQAADSHPARKRAGWNLADAIARDDAAREWRAVEDGEDGLIRGEDEPGEDEHRDS